MGRHLTLIAVTAVVLLAAAPAAALQRPGEPVTVTGAKAPRLVGLFPSRIVGFTYSPAKSKRHHSGKHRRGRWTQVPVQVDQRKRADFGEPPDSVTPGQAGTVYGTAPSGYTALQYADPATFVGADPNPRFDGDDELTFMAGDTGSRAPGTRQPPHGTRAAGATRIRVADPLASGDLGYIYLFDSTGTRKPAAGRDYVTYDFRLDSGPYKSTYRRGDGPNPERSRISTANYQIGFSDRWYYDRLVLRDGTAKPVDVLDGFKFGFGPGNCGRSEATFNDAEGAFVANIDGPVRAIRSYVGANSGPRTERTHYFYADRDEIVTDLRVHPVPGPLLYHDLSAAGRGMTFRSSASPGGVPVDGVADNVSSKPATWELWSGAQGSLFATDRVRSSFGDALDAQASSFYLDDATPSYAQCWGDNHAFGQFGYRSTADMPNTDPALGPADTMRSTTTEILGGPGVGAGRAAKLAGQVDAPLTAKVSGFGPS